jgi:AcrR family transcriptional regulator
MGRRPKFDAEQILDTAVSLVAEGGPGRATVSTIASRLGAPTASLYHRFASRDLLLARLWLRTVRRAQAGFIAALAAEDLGEAAVAAALHIPRWSREHLAEATVLLLYRREDLAARWPDELGDELAGVNRGIAAALEDFTRRRFGRVRADELQVVAFALVDVPYAAVRRYLLAGRTPPQAVDALVAKTCACVLDL